jgi:hypothetical protein
MTSSRIMLSRYTALLAVLFLAGCGATDLQDTPHTESPSEARQAVGENCETDQDCFISSGGAGCPGYNDALKCVPASDPYAASTCQCIQQQGGGGGPHPCSIPCGQGQTRNPDTCVCETPPPFCTVTSCPAGRFFNMAACECQCGGPPSTGCPWQQYYDYVTCACEPVAP